MGFLPGWFIKLVCLGLIWAYLHHFIAGVRHLWMDMTHSVSKEQGHSSAVITLAAERCCSPWRWAPSCSVCSEGGSP